MLADELDVVIGVDTHKRTHTAAVVAADGVVLEQVTVPADPAGSRRLVALADGHGQRIWAVEGTGASGAGLTMLLLARGQTVVEVDRPARRPRRAGAKNDDIDAVRAARQALSGEGTAVPRAADGGRRSGSCSPRGPRSWGSARRPSRPCTRSSPLPRTRSGNGCVSCPWVPSCAPAPR